MKPQLSRRWRRWAVPGIVFTAIVMAVPFVGENSLADSADPLITQAVARAASPSVREKQWQSEVTHVELERLARLQPPPEGAARDMEHSVEFGNVFSATSWYVPPPPPPPQPPAPPPAPSAPPVPFTYLGSYEDAPMALVILVSGERLYTVAEGDVIDDTYRIERVTAGRVELTYLPLNIKQYLNTGEAL